MRRLAFGFLVVLAVAVSGSYYWLEIRGPWERRFCEAMIGYSLQVAGSYQRIRSDRIGDEWRIQFAALNPLGEPVRRRAACLFSALEWKEDGMRPILTQFMIDGTSVDTSPFEEAAREIAGGWR